MIHRGQDRRQCMMGMSESGERTIYSFVKSISRKNIFDTHFKTSTTYHIFVTIKFPFQFWYIYQFYFYLELESTPTKEFFKTHKKDVAHTMSLLLNAKDLPETL